jgi:hypothetical protein
MSSIFSTSTMTRRSSSRHRRRSSSTSTNERYASSRSNSDDDSCTNTDVATMICIELSSLLISNPDVSTGVFFRTCENSRNARCRSDTTIIVTAAILEHIGNSRVAAKLLKSSPTCSKYYEEMGLGSQKTREMFVTMILAINPEMVRLIEMAIGVALDRAAEKTDTSYTDQRVANAIVALKDVRKITNEEMVKMTTLGPTAMNKVDSDNFIYRLKSDNKIFPSESVSVIGPPASSAFKSKFTEKDLMNYVLDKKKGKAPKFAEAFTDVPEPIEPKLKNNKSGLGYEKDEKDKLVLIRNEMMDDILGSLKLRTKELYDESTIVRRPRVEDALFYEDTTSSVFKTPPDSEDIKYEFEDRVKMSAPTLSVHNLPDSVIEEIVVPTSNLRVKSSYEQLMEAINEQSFN